MYGNVSHATVRVSAGDRWEPTTNSDGWGYLFVGDLQLCFGGGPEAIGAIDSMMAELVKLRAMVEEGKRHDR